MPAFQTGANGEMTILWSDFFFILKLLLPNSYYCLICFIKRMRKLKIKSCQKIATFSDTRARLMKVV